MKLTDPIPGYPEHTVAQFLNHVEFRVIPSQRRAARDNTPGDMEIAAAIIRAALEPTRSRKRATLRDQNFELSPVVHEFVYTHARPDEDDALDYAMQSEDEDARVGWSFYTSFGDEPVMHVADFGTHEDAIESIRGWFGDEVAAALS